MARRQKRRQSSASAWWSGANWMTDRPHGMWARSMPLFSTDPVGTTNGRSTRRADWRRPPHYSIEQRLCAYRSQVSVHSDRRKSGNLPLRHPLAHQPGYTRADLNPNRIGNDPHYQPRLLCGAQRPSPRALASLHAADRPHSIPSSAYVVLPPSRLLTGMVLSKSAASSRPRRRATWSGVRPAVFCTDASAP
jgi:hypothetical protein